MSRTPPDARAWEVGQPRSTCEAAEQSTGCGGGGGKGAGQGERGQQHTSRTQSRARRVQCAGPRAPSSTKGQQATVHRAAAPCQRRPSAGGLPDDQPEGRRRGRQPDMARLRTRPPGQPSGSVGPGPAWQLPGEAHPQGLHSQGRAGGYGRSGLPRWRTRSSSGPS